MGLQDARKISTGYAQPVEKQTLLSNLNSMLTAAHKERNFGLAMMDFSIFLKHFRSTTGDKVACDYLQCNSFFFIYSRLVKHLWILGFTAAISKKRRKIAAFELMADSKILKKIFYRKFEKFTEPKRL